MKKTHPIITHNASELAAVLGLSPADAVEIEVRSQLNRKIIQAARESGLTHEQLAKLARTSRTRLTAIINHDTTHVSTGLLMRILATLGYRTKISFNKTRHAA